MCGIVGVVSRPATRPIPDVSEVIELLDRAVSAGDATERIEVLKVANGLLLGVPGVAALSDRVEAMTEISARLDRLDKDANELDRQLASGNIAPDEVEATSALAIELRDVLWAIRNDRLRTVAAVSDLAGRDASPAALAAYLAIQQSFSAIDRLEVRGRDSAGIHVFVYDHALDLDDPTIRELIDGRSSDPTFQTGGVRLIDGVLSFVYKAAMEIGELGDNTATLRAAVRDDDLLRRALANTTARTNVLGHTRWASVGIISEPNTHPINSEELESSPSIDTGPYVVAALNGDVDNYADLKVRHDLRIHGQITTDAKVIPTMVSRAATDVDLAEAFRRSVAEFDGSVAIASMASTDPDTMLLALRGSGQGLYVGLGDDCYLVASEPYGVVEEGNRYLRLDGEHGGEVVVLDGSKAGSIEGITRLSYDGGEAPVSDDDIRIAEVTTRDIDRGDAPHFLFKEISEAPLSFSKTLRGKIADRDGMLYATLTDTMVPPEVRQRLANGSITRVRFIGQGTAAVAGKGGAEILANLCEAGLDVQPITATELSGFHMYADMSDTLAIAVSQSGTTTDTNTAVDLLRSRGAVVLAIVNRRGSDLAQKADGVLYTSDGRDVEMSVASTKAFYSQIAAGALMACCISAAAGLGSDQRRHDLLSSLRTLPDAMVEVLAKRDEIAEAARRYAPPKRYWAVVGNGPNKVAADEVRIKLSELCYKSIPSDITEDKKHIDLSCEPMILVCAAGLSGSTADDVAKETAIFSAHKSTPIVVCDEGDDRFAGAALIGVPAVDPALGFVLSAMVGHLFGYEAALAIDSSALPLRETRELVERQLATGADADGVLSAVREDIPVLAGRFFDLMRAGYYDGHLEASTAVNVAARFNNMIADRPVESFSLTTGVVGTPSAMLTALVDALSAAIDELTRPVDAIKHQAKTVTVGISRSDEHVVNNELVQAVTSAGAGRDVLSYRTLKVLAGLEPAVESVTGFTRYRIEGGQISIVDRGGISTELASRTDSDARLMGTKHRVADTRELLVARGRRDGRIVIFVPEVKGGATTGITLLHVTLKSHLDPETARGVLQSYDNRYARLVDWVTETEGDFDHKRLADIDVETLLIEPISDTADAWRSSGS